MCQAKELKRPWTYPTDLQDLGSSDCCGSSEEGKDSQEDTYVDEFSSDDDDSDSEGDVEKRDTSPFRMLSCARW